MKETRAFLIFVAMALGGQGLAFGDAIFVQDARIARTIEARKAVSTGSVFSPDIGGLFFWTQIKSAQAPITLTHRWYWSGKAVAEVKLEIRANTWRTWSRKTILPHQLGDWRATVEDAEGKVLAEASFQIKPEAASGAP